MLWRLLLGYSHPFHAFNSRVSPHRYPHEGGEVVVDVVGVQQAKADRRQKMAGKRQTLFSAAKS
jgi:hypothetical protein